MSLNKKAAEQKNIDKIKHQEKLEKTWINNLKSDDSKIVIGALKNIAKNGSPASAEALIKLLITNPSPAIDEQVRSILTSLKKSEMLDVVIQWLGDDKTKDHTAFLVSCIWESGFQSEAHAEFLVDLAIKGDYMTCLEVLTVIENFEKSLPEGQVMNMIYNLDEALENGSEDKAALLLSLKEVIQSLG